MDAFAYQYQASPMEECTDKDHQSAFVITNDEAFGAWSGHSAPQAEVKVFNKLTTDETADRVRIQSYFYKTDENNSNDPSDTFGKIRALQTFCAHNVIPGHPNSFVYNADFDAMTMTVCPNT